MAPIDISATTAANPRASGLAQAQHNAPAQREAPATVAAASRPQTADAVAQGRASDLTRLRVEAQPSEPQAQRPDEDTLIHRSQSLSAALAEEIRLQQRLADLRKTISETETELRGLQRSVVGEPPDDG